MRLHAKDVKGEVWDLDEGRRVYKVLWVDVDAGLLEAYHTRPDGSVDFSKPTYFAKGRFKFVPITRAIVKDDRGAARCARCASTLTLPEDDLCPRCKAADRGQRNRMVVEPVGDLLVPRKCDKCSRRAAYIVSDEVGVSSVMVKDVYVVNGRRMVNPAFTRAATVGRRWYCPWHYSPPRLLDAKGEVIKAFEDDPCQPK